MYSFMLAALLLSPIVSKNPVIQDTVNDVNIHFTFGVRPGNYIQQYGPEIGLKLEYLLVHPLIIRSSIDFNSANINNARYPNGRKNSFDLALETLIYGGQKKISSFIGIGLVYSVNFFDYESGSGYGLNEYIMGNRIIDETEIEDKYGYRLIMGFRFHEIYSIEFGYQESRPNFTMTGHDSEETFTIYKSGQSSTVRITVGYLIPL